MKLCKDCKHMLVSQAFPNDPEFAKCERTASKKIEPVMGQEVASHEYCGSQRNDFEGRCGMQAIYWEAK